MKWHAEVHQRRLPTRLFTALASILVLLVPTSTWASGRAESAPKSWSALSRVEALKATLESAGFSLDEGKFGYRDAVKETCTGLAPQAGTNPWPNVTFFARFPADGEPYWKLGKGEAIVLVGQTPPAVKFFHYQMFAITVPGIPHRMMLPVGDAINMATLNTIGPDNHDRPIVYVITGNRETERLVRAAALKAGYPEAIINVEAISPVIAPLGLGPEGSLFALVHRTAVPLDLEAMRDYATLELHRIFRVTPNNPLKDDPQPVPVLRVRGTGHTEMSLYPSLKKLRQAILDRYAPTPAKELDSKLTQELLPPDYHEALCDKPFVGLQRGIDVFGASRDTVSITTYPRFRFREGSDEFVIVYGVNHQATGKATYSNFTLYADNERWLPVTDGSRSSNKYDVTATPGDSARAFLCPADASQCPPDVHYLYAWKVARRCNPRDLPYCMEVKAEFVDMEGQSYGCNLYDWSVNPPKAIGAFDLSSADLNFTWRAYVEPATSVGPDDNELLYDRAIYFGPYFTGP